ncbi:unnamed protein product [Bathycoccus prasinos]
MKRNTSPPPPPPLKMMKSEEDDEKGKEKKKKKTISRTSKSSSFFTNNKRPNNNNNNAFRTTKKHSRERYLRDDIFCGIKQAPVAYKGKDATKWILDLNAEEEKEEEKSGGDAKSTTKKENNNNIGSEIIYVVDANVCLHQLDVVSHPKAMRNVVVCTTVLEEVRNRSRNAYERVRRLCLEASSSTGDKTTSGRKNFFVFSNEFHKDTYVGEPKKGESANDRNDRAIREVVKFYQKVVGLCSSNKHNGTQKREGGEGSAGKAAEAKVILISDDRGNVLKAKEENLNAMSVREVVNKHFAKSFPELVDLCSTRTEECFGADENEIARNNYAKNTTTTTKASINKTEMNSKKSNSTARGGFTAFPEHLTKAQYDSGVSAGRYKEGKIRCSPYSPFSAYVDVGDDTLDVKIEGRHRMNRAMEGDVVGIEIIEDEDEEEEEEREKDDVNDDDNVVSLAPIVNESDVASVDDASAKTGAEMPPSLTELKAKVVRIVKRNWRDRGYACALDIESCADLARKQHENSNENETEDGGGRAKRVLCVPNDRKTPKIRINTRHAHQIASQRIVVVIDAWLASSPYPAGHFVRALGEIGETASETAALLLEADVDDRPFAPAVHKCVPPLPWKVTEEHVEEPNREDLRNLRVCSVDPPGCRDIDDALSAVVVPKNDGVKGEEEIEIGVHIADVTTFLKPGTPMDDEALRRGTTTYLVQRRLDMLPKPLTEDICSLRADVERLAFTVFWRVDPATMLPRNDVKPRFTKSIIKSSKALTYQKAQEIIDDETNDKSDLANDLRRLRDVSKALRAKRMEQGALTLASPEVRFELDDETSNPLDVSLYISRETNKMVEEMMLLANIAVAERIFEHYPSFALLRRHPEPREKMFLPLLETVKLLGLENKINCASNKTLAESLDACVREDDPYFNTLLRLQATRCMSTAKYCSTGYFPRNELHHYGLASPLYTHFTSPIRRYADVIVHRLLSASLGLISIDEVLILSVGKKVAIDNTNLFTKEIAETCNARHLAGQQAGRASAELHTLKFFKDRTTVAEARVFQIRGNNNNKTTTTTTTNNNNNNIKKGEKDEDEDEIVAFVPKYGIEARVKVSKGFNARQNMFGKLKVKIEVEQMPFGRSKLNVSIVE